MRMATFYIFTILHVLFTGCSSPPPALKTPNVLLICIDDLRPELKSFGAEYIHSPTLTNFPEKECRFNSHYVNAPSCGPSRHTLLTGLYGPLW